MFKTGKMEAFYKRYYPGMLMYASRLLGNELEWMADDCVQDAVMDTFEKRHVFENAERWKAHILACIHNKAVNALRKLSAKRNYMSTFDEQEHEQDAARALIEHEMLDELYSAISELSADDRALLRLSFEEGLKNADIAARLDIAEITVKKRKARMLSMLRERLNGRVDIDTLYAMLSIVYSCNLS